MHPFPPVSPDGLQCYVWYGWGILYSFRKLNLEEKLKHQMLFCKKQMKNYGCVILKEWIKYYINCSVKSVYPAYAYYFYHQSSNCHLIIPYKVSVF